MSSVDQLIRATTRVETTSSSGTGFFVARALVATCGHVVGPINSEVRVRCFDGCELTGRVLDRDDVADVALVEVEEMRDAWSILPLENATDDHRRSDWLAYGFPQVAKGAAVLIEGNIRLVTTRDARSRSSLQLYSDDSAAGNGAYLDGFSGSAVYARGRVIAQLRSTPKDKDGAAQLGLIFAVPAAPIIALTQRHRPDVSPRLRREPQPPNAPYDPTWYIHRTREEQRALDDLDARKPVVLVGPRFFGKSSLLQCIVESARNRERQRGRDARIADVDLGGLGIHEQATLKYFLACLLEAILRSLNADPREIMQRHMSDDGISPPTAATVIEEILQQSEHTLYLVLSRAEAIVEWKHLDLAANILRSWATGMRPMLRRFRFLAEFSTAPALVTHAMPSFNIACEPVIVGDLDHNQTLDLAALYELRWTNEEVDRLRTLVGGHPYLLRKAMFEAARGNMEIREVLDGARENGGVFSEFLDSHLKEIRSSEPLRNAACCIACGRRPPAYPANAVDRLCAAGIIRRGRGPRDLTLAYPLFQSHLEAMCHS